MTPRSAREEVAPVVERCAHIEAKELTKSLAAGSRANYRCPKQPYTSMGEYRPYMRPADEVAAEDFNAWIKKEKGKEFHQMLELIGEKVRQKFSKARDVFRFVDQDHSLKLDRNEVRYFLRFFNVVASQADKFFDGFEQDEDGEICYVEFLKLLWPYVNPGNETTPWRLTKAQNDHAREEHEKGFQLPNTESKKAVDACEGRDRASQRFEEGQNGYCTSIELAV